MPALEIPEDERVLVAACARREHPAFEVLLRRFSGALEAGCRRALVRSGLSKGVSDLEEAGAVVRERLWREASSVFGGFRFACPLEAWLRLVAYRTALNWVESEYLRRTPEPPEVEVPAFSLVVEVEEELAALAKGLEQLGERDREILQDAYFRGLDFAVLARRHGLARGSVGTTLARARERLGKIVKELYPDAGGA
jgi:RNA polymerase sigma factor (sigma-70 family)